MTSSMRILVIDDDPVMRELLEAVLGYAGHDVELHESGDGAVEQLEKRGTQPDVVLTDLHMPGLQGHELAARLLELRNPGTLLVGMSGSFPTEEETRLLDYFLQKPFTPEQFQDAVRAARGEQESPAEPLAARVPPCGVLDDAIFSRLAATVPAAQLRELYEMTLTDVRARLGRMQQALGEGDAELVKREAHAIKGSCGMVGAVELYTVAAATESGSDADSFALEKFAPACARLEGKLNERLAKLAAPTG